MELILIHIAACFLLIIGIIAIIGSITAINKKHTENETAIETKWFKWQAPIRLVFGLVCFTMIFLYTKFDNSSKIETLEKENKKLLREKAASKDNQVIPDSSNHFDLVIYHNTGKSILKGQLLVSVNYNEIRIKGSDVYDVNKVSLGNIIEVKTGDKYFVKADNVFWGVNILKEATDINADDGGYIEIEFYNTSS